MHLRLDQGQFGNGSDLQDRGTARHDEPGSDGAAQARSRHRGEERLEHDRRGRRAAVRRTPRETAQHSAAAGGDMFAETPAAKGKKPAPAKKAAEPPKPAAPALPPPRLVKTAKPVAVAPPPPAVERRRKPRRRCPSRRSCTRRRPWRKPRRRRRPPPLRRQPHRRLRRRSHQPRPPRRSRPQLKRLPRPPPRSLRHRKRRARAGARGRRTCGTAAHAAKPTGRIVPPTLRLRIEEQTSDDADAAAADHAGAARGAAS